MACLCCNHCHYFCIHVETSSLRPSILQQTESLLSRVEQSPTISTSNALKPSMTALVSKVLMSHSDIDVIVAVASCFNEITRITAPEAPYNDDLMKVSWAVLLHICSTLHLIDCWFPFKKSSGVISEDCPSFWKFGWHVKSLFSQESFYSWNCCKGSVMRSHVGSWVWFFNSRNVPAFPKDNKVTKVLFVIIFLCCYSIFLLQLGNCCFSLLH